jgi:hypothetical protein
VEPQGERRTQWTIETMRGFAILAVGAIWAIYGETLPGRWRVAAVTTGGLMLVGGVGIVFLVRTPRIEEGDRRRVVRVWSAGMIVVVGLLFTISGAALAIPIWIGLGVVAMLFGGAIVYVAARGPSHLPKTPDRPDS